MFLGGTAETQIIAWPAWRYTMVWKCRAALAGWPTPIRKHSRLCIEIRRNMTFDERFRQFLEMTEMVLRGYEDRVRREHPQASEREVFLRAAALRLGNETVRRVYGWSPEDGDDVMTASPGEGLLRLLEVFDRLEIPYMIGGSGASSVHGLTRTTADIDMVAKIGAKMCSRSSRNSSEEFYIDEAAGASGTGASPFIQRDPLPQQLQVRHLSTYCRSLPAGAVRTPPAREILRIFTGEPLELAVCVT